VLPLLRTLQKAWPDTSISWVIGKTEHKLMEGLQGVEFIIFDKDRGLKGWTDVRQQLQGREFPILLNLHASMRANMVSTAIKARRRIGFDRSRARDYQWLFCNEQIPSIPQQHVCDGMLGFARYLGIDETLVQWEIPLVTDDRSYAAGIIEHNGPVCVISPCSSQRARNFRNWSIENYASVVRHVTETHNAKVLVTGAPTDIELKYANALKDQFGEHITNLVGQTSLKQLVAIFEAADVVLAPDSGPVHMSTAVGTPVVGLYATSNPDRTGPFRGPLGLTINRYPDAVRSEFDKEVGELRWGQRVRNPDAMTLITVTEVCAALDKVLDNANT
jgi:heptosyltransferase I